jgi:O-6-methylguanine DNA methyltransferase
MKQNQTYYFDIFKTCWGWFGVLGTQDALTRIQLPDTEKNAVKKRLLEGIERARQNKALFSVFKSKILDYYLGQRVCFDEFKIQIDRYTLFQQKVLMNLRQVKFGDTVTYAQLAQLSGSPRASRAIGSVMAANPMPLVIPCHRVIKSDGTCGNFSGPGGTHTKKRMLDLEKSSKNQ